MWFFSLLIKIYTMYFFKYFGFYYIFRVLIKNLGQESYLMLLHRGSFPRAKLSALGKVATIVQ